MSCVSCERAHFHVGLNVCKGILRVLIFYLLSLCCCLILLSSFTSFTGSLLLQSIGLLLYFQWIKEEQFNIFSICFDSVSSVSFSESAGSCFQVKHDPAAPSNAQTKIVTSRRRNWNIRQLRYRV